jgi:anti-anti-sigma factor
VIESKQDPSGRTTITIKGRFNFACYEEFHRVVGETVPPSYVVDLRSVDYIDSAALGMLLLLRERVKEERARVTLLTGAGQPAEVLRLANFGNLFSMA